MRLLERDLEAMARAVGFDILHDQQGTWTIVDSARITLGCLVMLSVQEGWAVGSRGEIRHDTSGHWLIVPPPQELFDLDLTSVAFASPSGGWAIGLGGVIEH